VQSLASRITFLPHLVNNQFTVGKRQNTHTHTNNQLSEVGRS